MAEMKYTLKDSVFTFLMKQPEYAASYTWRCIRKIRM